MILKEGAVGGHLETVMEACRQLFSLACIFEKHYKRGRVKKLKAAEGRGPGAQRFIKNDLQA